MLLEAKGFSNVVVSITDDSAKMSYWIWRKMQPMQSMGTGGKEYC